MPPKPNGFPIAITQSPTLKSLELPNFTAFGVTPIPSDDELTLSYNYYTTHTDLSAHGDSMALPDRFGSLVTDRAKYYTYMLRSDPQHALEVGGNIYITANTSTANEGAGLLFQAKTGGFNTTSNAAIIPRIFLFWNKSNFVIFSKILSSRIGKTKYKAFKRSNKTRKFKKYLYYQYVHFKS